VKHVFNFKSIKKCMTIFLLSNLIFHLWRWFLLGELQHCGQDYKCVNLSSTADRKINVWLPFIFERKTTWEVNSKSSCEKNHYRDQPTKGGGQPHLKSMYEYTMQLKRKAVIQNEIMIHFNFPKPITNN